MSNKVLALVLSLSLMSCSNSLEAYEQSSTALEEAKDFTYFQWSQLTRSTWKPIPSEYDRPALPSDQVMIVIKELSFEELDAHCINDRALACNDLKLAGTWCIIYVPSRLLVGEFAYYLFVRHERAHCLGWPKDHPEFINATY